MRIVVALGAESLSVCESPPYVQEKIQNLLLNGRWFHPGKDY
jgi:hypothetical protein